MDGLQSQQSFESVISSTYRPVAPARPSHADFERGDGVLGGADAAELYQAARNLMSRAEYAPARKILRRVLNQASFAIPAVEAMIECAQALGQVEEHRRLLKLLIKIDDRAENHVALGNVALAAGEESEALRSYLTALQLLPEDSVELFEVFKNLGNIYVRCRDFEAAEENYNRAFVLKPDSAILLVNFGTLAIQRDNWEEALGRFRQAVAVAPWYDHAWVGLALVHRHYGDLELSWANLAHALDLNPDNRSALQIAASWVVKNQKWRDLITWLECYLERNGEDAEMSLILAQLWFVTGQRHHARLELTRGLALDPAVAGGAVLARLLDEAEPE